MRLPARPAEFEWVAGNLCLDFTNTVRWHEQGPREERLNNYADLVAWARDARLLTDEQSQVLLTEAERDPAGRDRALAEALEVREILHNLFSDVALHRPIDPERLEVFNQRLRAALSELGIVWTGESFDRKWTADAVDLGQIMRPVLAAAGRLLLDDQLRLVRRCANDSCGWLFLDLSRNRMRRWCDMRVCGSRAKARRHYQRKRHGAVKRVA